ncbi:MAG: glycerophosphodiester phosphodiesterase family protein [Chloroflexi bacterium]|nr:glycerophosphodiester phosphodiesterase family protein [Chloroflexota bacterium]
MTKTLIFAHRGDAANAPENTLPAFESALSKGADGIELDVYLTSDGKLVVHHDHYLGRTNEGSGFIGDFTLAELQRLDAGSWFDTAFSGERMPTLEQVLDLGRGGMRFQIEMKSSSTAIVHRVHETVSRSGLADAVDLTSFHVPLLVEAGRLKPRCAIGVFFADPLPEWMQPELRERQIVDWMIAMDAQTAHVRPQLLTSGFVDRMHSRGLAVHGADLDSEAEMRHAVAIGVDRFDTDRLETALRIRAERLQQ